MSDSRVDYQPLRSDPPDTPGRQSFSRRDHGDEDEDDGTYANETQELVSHQERDVMEFLSQQQEQDQQDKDDGAGAGTETAIRLQAFFCAALLGVSTHYTRHITGPLKDVLKEVKGSTLRVMVKH